jgi:hypothetical protein
MATRAGRPLAAQKADHTSPGPRRPVGSRPRGPLRLRVGVGDGELVVAAHPDLADLRAARAFLGAAVEAAADVGVRQQVGVLRGGLRPSGGRRGHEVAGERALGVPAPEGEEGLVERVAAAHAAEPLAGRAGELGHPLGGQLERLHVLVVHEGARGVLPAGVAGHAPADVGGLGLGEVLLPRRVVLDHLELRLREDGVDVGDRVGHPPAVAYLRYPPLGGQRLEVELREVALDEAAAGDEGAGHVVEAHVLGPEGREGRVDEALPVEQVERPVDLAPLDAVLAGGRVVGDEVHGLLRERPLAVGDDHDARLADPEDRREGQGVVGVELGHVYRGDAPVVEAAHEAAVELRPQPGVDEGYGVAAHLARPAAEARVVRPVEVEAADRHAAVVGLAADAHVDDLGHEELVREGALQGAGLVGAAGGPVAPGALAVGLDAREKLRGVRVAPAHLAYLAQDYVVPDGDEVPVEGRPAAAVAVQGQAVLGEELRRELVYLILILEFRHVSATSLKRRIGPGRAPMRARAGAQRPSGSPPTGSAAPGWSRRKRAASSASRAVGHQ